MPKEAPHLFQFVTQEEFSLLFAMDFILDFELYEGSYPLDRYATRGVPPGRPQSHEEAFRRGIRYLVFEHEYEFEGLTAHEDDRILAYRVVCPENALYVKTMQEGKLPHVLVNLRRAIEFAKREIPGFPVEPLQDAEADVKASVKNILEADNPDEWEEWEEIADTALDALGVQRHGGVN